ncbi:MAG: UPF0182 family protein [Patescibacteria group bacterium]
MLGFIVVCLIALIWVPFFWAAGKYLVMKDEGVYGERLEKAGKRSRKFLALGGLGTIVLMSILTFFSYWTDYLWFEEVNYLEVFETKIAAQILTFLIPSAVVFCFLFGIMKMFLKFVPPIPENYRASRLSDWRKNEKIAKTLIIVIALIIAVLFGFFAFSWEEVLLYYNSQAAGKADPIFGRDISFYFFELPFLKSLTSFFILMVSSAMAEVLFLRLNFSDQAREVNGEEEEKKVANLTIKFLSVKAGVLFLIFAFRVSLWKYSLLFDNQGVFHGAGYTAVNAILPMLNVMMVILVLSAIAMVIAGFLQKKKKIIVGAIAAPFTVLVILVVYSVLVQHFSVKPEELDKETPYIQYNIELTRQAFGLDSVEAKKFEPNDRLSLAELEEERLTLENVRLWDWRALAATYKQTQEIRQYYEFSDLDIDRYTISGRYRTVMVSPRELPISQLPRDSQTWVNTRLKYTHGFGAVLSPVNEFTAEGMPNYYLKDIPPHSNAVGLGISQPRIYFGEMAESHIFVNATTLEFDYPSGDENVFVRYDGTAGIALSSFWRKLAFAWRFDGMPILLSDYLTDESRIIFRRNITERVRTVAPFLQLDEDPYFVILETGAVVWIIDAYTISANYPYSTPNDGLNYIRNSVKVAVDAKNGEVRFYVFDEEDPILRTWQAIFPDIFLSRSKMPKDLLRHVRYPEDMFRIQARVLATYHMTNPQIFYNREDLWEIAKEPTPIGGKPVEIKDKRGCIIRRPPDMQSYYTIIKLPGEQSEEFLQILPFTPATKQNMIAWLAGRCDGDDYGKLLLYEFPKDRLVFGPMQIAARMNQDKEMSSQLSLWNQQGSEVNIENILVIPVRRAILYVIPVYLQAEQSRMPELKKVVVAYGERIVWADSFDEALAKIFGLRSEPERVISEQTQTGQTEEKSDLLRNARTHFENFQKLTSEGRHAEAGRELEELGRILQQF